MRRSSTLLCTCARGGAGPTGGEPHAATSRAVAVVTFVLLAVASGCTNKKPQADECEALSRQAHALSDALVEQSNGDGDAHTLVPADSLKAFETVLVKEENVCTAAGLPERAQGARKMRDSLSLLVERAKASAKVVPHLPEDPPPLLSADTVPALEASLAADAQYQALWGASNKSNLKHFLTLVSEELATMTVAGGTAVNQDVLDAVKASRLDSAARETTELMLRTGAFSTEFQSKFAAYLDSTTTEPHMGTWSSSKASGVPLDYSALAAWMRRGRPEYVREFITEKHEGPFHWSDFVTRDPQTGATQAPLRRWLAREGAALAWLGSISTLSAEESARAANIAASSLGDDPGELVEISRLLSEYKSNEVRADGKFRSHVIQISGVAREIKKNAMNRIYVVVGTERAYEVPEVHCLVPDRLVQQAASYSKGDKLTVRGRVHGMVLTAVVLEDCEFVD